MSGYDKLATLMGTHQDMAIFRSFARLNIYNILSLQAELIHLEAELDDIAAENLASRDQEKQAFQTSFFHLKASEDTDKELQWQKTLEIRRALNSYNIAVLQHHQLQRLQKPTNRNVEVLKEWLDRPEGGDFFLRGREADAWNNERDVITTSNRQSDPDLFTRVVTERMVPWYHCRWGFRISTSQRNNSSWMGIWHYDDNLIATFASVIGILLSGLLPASSILILYMLKSPFARLAVAMIFTVSFSITLALIARPRRIEAFAATTAFAAVQVVFVMGTGFRDK